MFHPWPTKAKKSITVSVPTTYSERTSRGATSAAARIAEAATRSRVLPGTKQTGGANEQHEDEEAEDADLRERAMQEQTTQRFHDAHEEAAQQRPGEGA